MAQPTGTLGAKLSITDAAIAASINSEALFTAQNWTEVALVTSFGDFGRVFTPVNFQSVAEGRTYKLKGGYDDGAFQTGLGQDLSDAGQALLKGAAEASDQSNWGFRIEFNDPPASYGGPTTFFFRGLPTSFKTQMGGLNDVVRAMADIQINSDIILMPPADLYDRFVTGGSLAHWTLFNGSDAQAVDPVISSNALSCVSGDAGTGFAADGSQAVADNGFVPSAGAIVVEARLKISAITNVGPVFFGLTDQKASLEAPIESAASTDDITTNATDAVGFMFDTSMATDDWWLVGVNNDVDETAQDVGDAPTADTYQTLRIEVAANGDTVFKIDGTVVGTTMTTAVATGVTLYPTLCIGARSTASRTLTADYFYARQD